MGAAFLTGWSLIVRWAPRFGVPRAKIDGLILWLMVGTIAGARAYFIAQNDPGTYLQEPWRVLAIWEGGLAFFGGLFGGIAAGFLYARHHGLPFAHVADLAAPAIAIGGAIGRIACGLAGIDYGTATSLPWGVIYTHASSYAPNDGVPRHPVQFYELIGDLAIAALLIRLRGRLPAGAGFLTYLVLFAALRFALFFVRGDVPRVAFGLANGHWTALAILAVTVPILLTLLSRRRLSLRAA